MKYEEILNLKNGNTALIRNGNETDGSAVFEIFNLTHSETDFLLSYQEENTLTAEKEAAFLKEKAVSSNEVELVAIINGRIVGLAGIEAVGNKYKVKHRAVFGISVLKEFWELGVGKALTLACIKCAKDAGYSQLELNVVADNERALSLYRKLGFVEFGRNPKGFNSKNTGYQELIYMLLEL